MTLSEARLRVPRSDDFGEANLLIGRQVPKERLVIGNKQLAISNWQIPGQIKNIKPQIKNKKNLTHKQKLTTNKG